MTYLPAAVHPYTPYHALKVVPQLKALPVNTRRISVGRAALRLRYLAAALTVALLGIAMTPLPAAADTVPGAPTIGTATGGNAEASVTFTAPVDTGGGTISAYTVSCTSADGGASGSSSGAASPLTVTSLTNGKTYTCTATATNEFGTSDLSAASNSFIPATVPDAPTIATATRRSTEASVAFTAPLSTGGSAITSYTGTCTSSDGGTTGSTSGSNSPIIVTGLTNGKTYTCSVTATNAVGTSISSAASNAIVPAVSVADAPTIGTATRGNAQISVTYSGPSYDGGSAITGYTATCASSNGGATGSQSASSSPITVSGLTNGASYACTVAATNAVDTGPASAESNSVVPATVPDAPTIGTLTRGNTQISVTYSGPSYDGGSAITGYTATCASSNGGATGSESASSSPITVPGLTNGASYTCTVSAVNQIGVGAASAGSNGVIPATVPGAPSQAVATRGESQLSVAFTAPASDGGDAIIGYTVTCAGTGGSPGSAMGTSSPISVPGLTNGVSYSCTVVAANTVGSGSASPASATTVPATVPSAPVIGTATRGNAQISVTFTAPTSDGGSTVTSYSTACVSSNGGPAGSATSTASPVVVSGLVNGYSYTCSVTASNAVGTGTASAATNSAVPATLPGAPVIGVAERRDASILVRFSGPASNGGAVISSYTATCTSSNGGISGSAVGPGGPLTVLGLTNGATYVCSVRATNAVGIGPASVASNSIIPATLPGAPTIGTATRGDAKATVTFTPPASDGGMVVTSYTARCSSSDGGATKSATGAASPIVVSGLTNSKTYTCSVRAANGIGTGVRSEYSNTFVPATTPGSPTSVTALATGSGKLRVSFTAPANNGGAVITGYSATCTSADGGTAGTRTGAASPIAVTGLTNGRHYTCAATTINAVGSSPATTAPLAWLAMLPVSPTNVVATSGSTTGTTGTLTVTYTAGASVGSTVTSFQATCTSATGGVTRAGTRLASTAGPISVAGLTTAKSYACRVTATNGVGTSSNSPSSALVSVGAPAAPIGIAAVRVAAGSLRVSFTPGATNGAVVASHTVTCSSSNGGVQGTANGSSSPTTVTGLTATLAYTCTVITTSNRGSSVRSAASAMVTA